MPLDHSSYPAPTGARRRTWRLVVALLGAAACQRGESPVSPRDEGRFGHVQAYAPTNGGAAGLVFLFSDADGWNAALDGDARALAGDGVAVVGVDLPQYLRGLAESDDGCHYLISEVEDLSKRLQRDLDFPVYRTPILAGIGAGGALTYAALAQTPAATVAGAVSVDPAPTLATRVPLCPGAPSTPAVGGGFSYGVAPSLPGWWLVSRREALPASLQPLATPEAAEGSAAQRLLAATRAGLATASAAAPPALAELPLVEVPAEKTHGLMAIIYSGDGGWRDIDKELGETLAAGGVPVVGVDSLRYFWRKRTPEEVGQDLGRIIDAYGTRWQTPRVILVGYSFGADILPFAYNRLPAAGRDRVALVSLLGVEPRAAFEFSVTGWFGGEPPADAPAVLPEVLRIPADKVQCFYGEEEDDTLCRDPALAGVELIQTTGGHHFDGEYDALAQRMITGVHRRESAAKSAKDAK
ncbi:MAG TPA: AcvB/VirJ family lysyl-phosphatidylglycerol hydrolase [Candidatus Dormibacteraeota bacterium]|nr:AcvB/VirJ family lysyl-phosphatidylglycerol hydrolase [Candidatus Dormibacteraeota bacterium]